MAKVLIQARVPEELHLQMETYRTGRNLSPTECMVELIGIAFTHGTHAQFTNERIPTPKKKATWSPLSQHTKARLQVLRSFGSRLILHGATSSDISYQTNQSTNNVSKRLRELADEGYIEPSGEYRKSRDSGKNLMVWRRTAKEYKGV